MKKASVEGAIGLENGRHTRPATPLQNPAVLPSGSRRAGPLSLRAPSSACSHGMSTTYRVLSFVKLGRPRFLVAGVLLFALGAALAAVDGASIVWRRYAWGQCIVTSTQWMTHYANEYFDVDADRANPTPTTWSGGSRVLPQGVLPPRVALVAALALAACALVATYVAQRLAANACLVLQIALSMIALSWAYSAPPARLLSRGLGELTTALVVTLLTPLLGYSIQSGRLGPLPLVACLPLCALQVAMLLTIELPDAAGDAATGKRTLVVRRGAQWGAHLSAWLVALSFCALPLLVLCHLPWQIAGSAALLAPLGAWQATRLWRGAFRDPRHWASLASCSVSLLAATALAELLGALLKLTPTWR